jgi:hypothetical protein
MKKNTSWLMAALIALMVSECVAQADSVIIAGSPAVTNLQGVGINLSSATYWGGSADYLQNILQNPGFEPSTAGRVIQAPSGVTSTTKPASSPRNQFVTFHNMTQSINPQHCLSSLVQISSYFANVSST